MSGAPRKSRPAAPPPASAAPAPASIPACEPPWWASNGQLQTLAGHLLPSAAPPLSRARRFEVELADGDRLAVHALEGTSDTRVVLVHGLSGDVDSDYMRRTALVAQRLGHHVWAVNLRNAGSGRGLARRPYHSGCVADLRAVLELSHAQAPHLRRVLVGFSLAGNLALLLAADVTPLPSRPLPPVLGPSTLPFDSPAASVAPAPDSRIAPMPAEPRLPMSSGSPTSPLHSASASASTSSSAPATSPAFAAPSPLASASAFPTSPALAAAPAFAPTSTFAVAPVPCEHVLAVNPPVDLASAADRTHRGFNRLYELRFVARLRRDIARLARSGLRPTAPIGPFTSLRDLDDRFTAPVSGFASAAEYYERCSSLPHLARIRVPTVILTSLDDPLVDATHLLTAPLSPSTQLHAERHGGHMGYLSRSTPTRWLDHAMEHYLEEA